MKCHVHVCILIKNIYIDRRRAVYITFVIRAYVKIGSINLNNNIIK